MVVLRANERWRAPFSASVHRLSLMQQTRRRKMITIGNPGGTCREAQHSLVSCQLILLHPHSSHFSGISLMPSSTILVVEDDAIVRMLIVDVLEELEYQVLEAADAEQALVVVKDTDNIKIILE
jgi:hypothetical protein